MERTCTTRRWRSPQDLRCRALPRAAHGSAPAGRPPVEGLKRLCPRPGRTGNPLAGTDMGRARSMPDPRRIGRSRVGPAFRRASLPHRPSTQSPYPEAMYDGPARGGRRERAGGSDDRPAAGPVGDPNRGPRRAPMPGGGRVALDLPAARSPRSTTSSAGPPSRRTSRSPRARWTSWSRRPRPGGRTASMSSSAESATPRPALRPTRASSTPRSGYGDAPDPLAGALHPGHRVCRQARLARGKFLTHDNLVVRPDGHVVGWRRE